LKVDQLDVVANEKVNKVTVSLNNSDPEKTSMSFFSQLITDKEMLRAKVSHRIQAAFELHFCNSRL
jgi:hypothetical protein